MSQSHADDIRRLMRGWTRVTEVARELKRLPLQLEDGEHLHNLDRAEHAGGTGLLAVTDHRLLFLCDTMFRKTEVSYPYEDLTAVTLENHLLGGRKLVIDTGAGTVEMRKLEGERAARMCAYIQERLAPPGAPEPVPVPARGTDPDPVEAIKRLLGAAGVLLTPVQGRLRQVFQGSEVVGAVAYGALGTKPGLLVATTRRVVFVGATADQDVALAYPEIEEVRLRGAGGLRFIEIRTRADRMRVGPVPPGPGKAVADFAGERAGTAPAAPRTVPARDAPPVPVPPAPAPRETVRPAPSGPVEINSATSQQLQDALGLSAATAAEAVLERGRKGGFADFRDFADALDLPPHVRARLAPLVTVVAPARASPPRTDPRPVRPQRRIGETDPL